MSFATVEEILAKVSEYVRPEDLARSAKPAAPKPPDRSKGFAPSNGKSISRERFENMSPAHKMDWLKKGGMVHD